MSQRLSEPLPIPFLPSSARRAPLSWSRHAFLFALWSSLGAQIESRLSPRPPNLWHKTNTTRLQSCISGYTWVAKWLKDRRAAAKRRNPVTNAHGPAPLLLSAVLTHSGSDARAACRAWRQSADIQHLSWPDPQLIPVLNGPRFHEWLTDDPASGLLKGIVRRAWTEAQVRLALAQETMAGLDWAGCHSVTLFGPAALYVRNDRPQSIRPVSEIRLLIPRMHLDWTKYTLFFRNGVKLYLHWRVLSVAAHQASACEHSFLASRRFIESNGTLVGVLALGHDLLAAVAPRTESGADVIPWQIDASLIPKHDIQRTCWIALATAYSPQAVDRMSELRALGMSTPILRPVDGPAQAPSLATVLRNWGRRVSRRAGRLLAVAEKV